MQQFDLAISYKWVYDKDFVNRVETLFHNYNLTTYVIHKDNIGLVTSLLKNNDLSFKVYLDRASDEDENFEEIAQLIKRTSTYIINNYDIVESAIDKSVMHHKLINAGLNLPETIIVPPIDELHQTKISASELEKIGIPFIIKPAYYSGGGEGIILNGKTIEEISELRKENSDDNYLVQKTIYPKMNGNDRCWFRSFWFLDEAFPLWWDDRTHIYRHISPEEFDNFNVCEIKEIMNTIATVSEMDYFSTEIAIDQSGDFVVIDYVNDQCDMRFKSKYFNGVPNDIIDQFIYKLINKSKNI